MRFSKPFHRNYRAIKPGPNSGYSGWAYIHDRDYAKNAGHYVRALVLIQNDLQSIFEYLEPSDECRTAFSYRIHALLMCTCIEVEANFKAILEENTFTPRRSLNMTDYRKVDATHHLSSYELMLPIWNGTPPILKPFEPWKPARGLGLGPARRGDRDSAARPADPRSARCLAKGGDREVVADHQGGAHLRRVTFSRRARPAAA
jgi:hypothetical protein